MEEVKVILCGIGIILCLFITLFVKHLFQSHANVYKSASKMQQSIKVLLTVLQIIIVYFGGVILLSTQANVYLRYGIITLGCLSLIIGFYISRQYRQLCKE